MARSACPHQVRRHTHWGDCIGHSGVKMRRPWRRSSPRPASRDRFRSRRRGDAGLRHNAVWRRPGPTSAARRARPASWLAELSGTLHLPSAASRDRPDSVRRCLQASDEIRAEKVEKMRVTLPKCGRICFRFSALRKMGGGEAGIRTLGRGYCPFNGLANRRLQPLGHLTAREGARPERPGTNRTFYDTALHPRVKARRQAGPRNRPGGPTAGESLQARAGAVVPRRIPAMCVEEDVRASPIVTHNTRDLRGTSCASRRCASLRPQRRSPSTEPCRH